MVTFTGSQHMKILSVVLLDLRPTYCYWLEDLGLLVRKFQTLKVPKNFFTLLEEKPSRRSIILPLLDHKDKGKYIFDLELCSDIYIKDKFFASIPTAT